MNLQKKMAIVCAIVGCVLSFLYLRHQELKVMKQYKTIGVWVAKNDIAYGKKITQSEIVFQHIPKVFIAGTPIFNSEQLFGRAANVMIPKNALITQENTGLIDHHHYISSHINDNHRAITLEGGSVLLGAGIMPNDYVDIFATLSVEKQDQSTQITFSLAAKLKVISASDVQRENQSKNNMQMMPVFSKKNRSITVLCPQELVADIVFTMHAGQLNVILRDPNSNELNQNISAVQLADMIDRHSHINIQKSSFREYRGRKSW